MIPTTSTTPLLFLLCFGLSGCAVHEVRNDPSGREVTVIFDCDPSYAYSNPAIKKSVQEQGWYWPKYYYLFLLEDPDVTEPLIAHEVTSSFNKELLRIPVTTRARTVVARMCKAYRGDIQSSSQPVTISLPEGACTVYVNYGCKPISWGKCQPTESHGVLARPP
jgi:hypothetical protein